MRQEGGGGGGGGGGGAAAAAEEEQQQHQQSSAIIAKSDELAAAPEDSCCSCHNLSPTKRACSHKRDRILSQRALSFKWQMMLLPTLAAATLRLQLCPHAP